MKIKSLCINELDSHFQTIFPGNATIKYLLKNIDENIFNMLDIDGNIKILSKDKAKSYGGYRHNIYLSITLKKEKIREIRQFECNINKLKNKGYFLAYKENGILKLKKHEEK